MKKLFLATALGLLSTQAFAQPAPCGPSDVVRNTLSEGFGEHMAFYGLTQQNNVVEIWIGDGTWSALLTTPDGRSCVVSSGFGWVQAEANNPPNL